MESSRKIRRSLGKSVYDDTQTTTLLRPSTYICSFFQFCAVRVRKGRRIRIGIKKGAGINRLRWRPRAERREPRSAAIVVGTTPIVVIPLRSVSVLESVLRPVVIFDWPLSSTLFSIAHSRWTVMRSGRSATENHTATETLAVTSVSRNPPKPIEVCCLFLFRIVDHSSVN